MRRPQTSKGDASASPFVGGFRVSAAGSFSLARTAVLIIFSRVGAFGRPLTGLGGWAAVRAGTAGRPVLSRMLLSRSRRLGRTGLRLRLRSLLRRLAVFAFIFVAEIAAVFFRREAPSVAVPVAAVPFTLAVVLADVFTSQRIADAVEDVFKKPVGRKCGDRKAGVECGSEAGGAVVFCCSYLLTLRAERTFSPVETCEKM